MRSDLEEVLLGDIVEFLNAKRVPLSSKSREHKKGIYPYYGASGIIDYLDNYIFDGEYLLISEDGENLKTRKTPIAFIVKGKYWVNNHAHILDEKEEGILEYLKYYFSALSIQPYLTGAVQPKLNKKTLSSIPIKLMSKIPRLKINHILSTLDNKIELNRKMNQTLEEMAQSLFKSWFIDFDPIHARANSKESDEVVARELGISEEVLKLFPSAFVESELGLIPDGWENDYLESFVEILDSKRKPMSKMEREKKKGNIPYYGATSIMDYVDDYIFYEPLTLIGEDGSVARKDGTPFMQYIWDKSWINNHAHVLKSKSTLSTEAIYIALLKQNVTMFITGAVQPKINQTNLKKIPLIRPSKNLHKVYSELIEPIFSKIRQLREEANALQKTRDTLLPKLLSGELDVKNIEERSK